MELKRQMKLGSIEIGVKIGHVQLLDTTNEIKGCKLAHLAFGLAFQSCRSSITKAKLQYIFSVL